METIYILVAAVIIIAAILWYVLGRIARGIRTVVSSVVIIVLILFTGYLYYDSKSMQTNFASNEKLFVFTSDTDVLAAFTTTTGSPVVKSDLTLLRTAYAAHDLKQLKGAAYKLLIFNPQSFASVASVNLSGVILSRDEALALLASSTPKQDFVDRYKQANDINSAINDEALGSDDNLKGYVFASFVGDLSTHGDFTMMTRNGVLTIYPDSVTLWLIRAMPTSLLHFFVGGAS